MLFLPWFCSPANLQLLLRLSGFFGHNSVIFRYIKASTKLRCNWKSRAATLENRAELQKVTYDLYKLQKKEVTNPQVIMTWGFFPVIGKKWKVAEQNLGMFYMDRMSSIWHWKNVKSSCKVSALNQYRDNDLLTNTQSTTAPPIIYHNLFAARVSCLKPIQLQLPISSPPTKLQRQRLWCDATVPGSQQK